MAQPPKLTDSLAPVGKTEDPAGTEIWKANQNEDGSTAGRKAHSYRYVGLDVTPTFSVAAEFDEVVRVIAHGFEEGTVAVLQSVQGNNSGDAFSDVVYKGIPVALTHEHTVITVPISGRYRLIFPDGWENHAEARVSVLRQERVLPWGTMSGGALLWERTGVVECRAGLLYRQEQNQHGRLRWVTTNEDCGWESTNEFQCRADHHVWERQRNLAGDFRWVDTGRTCYDPTYSLPCGGWGFGPGDVRDPAATVELTDCFDDTPMGVFIYPTPAPGHTVPVGDCFKMCVVPDDIVGYAANKTQTGVRNACYDGPKGGCDGA